MKIVTHKITALKSAEYNPRKISPNDFEALKESIRIFGIVEPVVINTHKGRENIIIGGHQRLYAMKECGYKEVPCFEIDLTPALEKELNVRLNRNTGEFDKDILMEFFNPEDLQKWGFEEEEVDFFNKEEEAEEWGEKKESKSLKDDQLRVMIFGKEHPDFDKVTIFLDKNDIEYEVCDSVVEHSKCSVNYKKRKAK